MSENILEEFRDSIRCGTKSIIFQLLAEMYKELINEPNENVIEHFWKRFRLIGYSKIKCAADLYLHKFGYYEFGPERFSRIRTVEHSKHVIGIGIFLINQAYRV